MLHFVWGEGGGQDSYIDVGVRKVIVSYIFGVPRGFGYLKGVGIYIYIICLRSIVTRHWLVHASSQQYDRDPWGNRKFQNTKQASPMPAENGSVHMPGNCKTNIIT